MKSKILISAKSESVRTKLSMLHNVCIDTFVHVAKKKTVINPVKLEVLMNIIISSNFYKKIKIKKLTRCKVMIKYFCYFTAMLCKVQSGTVVIREERYSKNLHKFFFLFKWIKNTQVVLYIQ
jgi:hypothetical protein